ncbi:hypothetical protein LPJ75_003912 [Coemansia sp. RSA 2598]|nr:hypothetical protein LPJ75_003912 [Coemansia sp. RSA 2598]
MSASVIDCPYNSIEATPPRVRSFAIEKALSSLGSGPHASPASGHASYAVDRVNGAQPKGGLLGRMTTAIACIRASPLKALRRPALLMFGGRKAASALENGSDGAGTADGCSAAIYYKDDSFIKGAAPDPADDKRLQNLSKGKKGKVAAAITNNDCAASETAVIAESIGPALSRRNQSLRGCPEQLACQQNLQRSETKKETAALNASSSSIRVNANSPASDMFAVLYPYSPVECDELRIEPGDQVRLLHLFSDGWTFVQKTDDGAIGAVPAVCLDTDPSDLVD